MRKISYCMKDGGGKVYAEGSLAGQVDSSVLSRKYVHIVVRL